MCNKSNTIEEIKIKELKRIRLCDFTIKNLLIAKKINDTEYVCIPWSCKRKSRLYYVSYDYVSSLYIVLLRVSHENKYGKIYMLTLTRKRDSHSINK